MIASLAKLRRLTPPQRRILYAAAVLIPLVAARLRLGGMKRVRASMGPLRAHCASADALAAARDIARLVSVAARHGLYRGECLPTALALQWLLNRHGIESDLRLGVRRNGRLVEAHAWIEHRGVALIDGADVHERFGAFDPLRHPG